MGEWFWDNWEISEKSGRIPSLRVRGARSRLDLLRRSVRPRGAAAPGDPVRPARASGPGEPRPVAPKPVEPVPQPAGGEVWGDKILRGR